MPSEKKQVKRYLVLSYGPVPTPDSQTIEGGGMRAWGLATGLTQNGYDVTVGVNQSFPQSISLHQKNKIINWQEGDDLINLINQFDVVIVSYAMGSISSYIAERIDDSVTLVLDCYVPIYIEVSARQSHDLETELINYRTDMSHANKTLTRGDYFLCANNAQKHMYTGILASMGIINPITYLDERIIVVPFGVEKPLSGIRY
jgi:hypothetical protein